MTGTAPGVPTTARAAGTRRSGESATRAPPGSGARGSQALDLASFYIGSVAAVWIAGKRGQEVTRHVNIVRRLAEIELRLPQEPATFTDDLENPARFDPLGGDLGPASRLVGGTLLIRDGTVLPGRSVPATSTPSLALTAPFAATAAPSPAAAARSAAAILGIARFPRAVLSGTPGVVGALAIGWLGR